MVTKHTTSGRPYEIENGKRLIWHADVDTEAGEQPFDVRIPLRMKVGVLRPLAGGNVNDVAVTFALLEGIIPDQADKLDQLDVNDMNLMFETWQDEYTQLNGTTPGEPSGSSS